MNKIEARKLIYKLNNKVTSSEKEWSSNSIIDCISSLEVFKKAKNVFIFINKDDEPNTEELIGLSLMMEKNVSVPKINGDIMEPILITPYSLFKKNKWGINEPVSDVKLDNIDLTIVPMVGYDGIRRLGHGKGFYDRFLSNHDCFKIGIAFSYQKVQDLEINDYDINMDMVVTEKEIIEKNKTSKNVFWEQL